MIVLGLDGGIASIGWALVDRDADEATGRIVAAGTRMFDAPETDKERIPTNAVRRQKRLARRTLRRRRQRMAAIRDLMARHGLLACAARDAPHMPRLDPWKLRAEGLERRLTRDEFAVALGHIARHRGFWSNAKRDRGANADPDTSKMLAAIGATREKLAGWPSIGAMLALAPEFSGRKRNRAGDYSRTVTRDDLRHEVRALFAAQRRFGGEHADPDLEAEFAERAFSQRALQDSEHLLGACPFEPGEKRTAKRGYSFERFRLLSRLAQMRLSTGHGERPLTPDEIGRASADFGAQQSLTYKTLRRLLDLPPGTRFADVSPEDEGRDATSRHGKAALGTAALREAAGGMWASLLHAPGRLDRIAEILSFRETLESIAAGLDEAGIEPTLRDAIMRGADAGRFKDFSGAAHISSKAARAILPHLARGLVYSEACAEVGYDHAAQRRISLADVKNAVARKALGEMVKQVRAIVARFGLPDRIHVELARDLGKSAEERSEVTRGIERRNREKDRRRTELAELLGRPPSDDELLRYELWREQGRFCLYSGDPIPVEALAASDNAVQVDHILPWSRFSDDSFINKTLCFARENQHKLGRTPYEWFMAERADRWELFQRRVESCLEMKGAKKRGFYLRQNAAEVEERFRSRNLNDTRYACRLLLAMLKRLYPKDDKTYVFARPGALTSKLRRGWGLEHLKKDAEGKRLEDDRHHALDAIVVAATSQSMLNRLTRKFQEAERRGSHRDFAALDQPWDGFRTEAEDSMKAVFVSREERRRVSGKKHDDTIKQVRVRDGRQVVFERRDVMALKDKDVERIKDPDRNAAIAESLRQWIAAGRPRMRRRARPRAT